MNANYMLVIKEKNRTWKAYERTHRRVVRHAKFITKFGTALSVCALSLRKPGKVVFYNVAGHPEKREEVKRVKDIK